MQFHKSRPLVPGRQIIELPARAVRHARMIETMGAPCGAQRFSMYHHIRWHDLSHARSIAHSTRYSSARRARQRSHPSRPRRTVPDRRSRNVATAHSIHLVTRAGICSRRPRERIEQCIQSSFRADGNPKNNSVRSIGQRVRVHHPRYAPFSPPHQSDSAYETWAPPVRRKRPRVRFPALARGISAPTWESFSAEVDIDL